MRVLIALVVVFSAATAAPTSLQRIVGGGTATISQYPEIVALLYSNSNSGHRHICGGTIISARSVLTAAQCTTLNDDTNKWRIRAGSVNANSGGSVLQSLYIINHADFDRNSMINDISIIRTTIAFTNLIRPTTLPPLDYTIPDNQGVSAVGWGATSAGGASSPRLRHVELQTVNQQDCVNNYGTLRAVTATMLCAGWNMGARGQCVGDEGGPLFHGTTIVGILSWSSGCGQPFYPSVNTRVSSFITTFIQPNL